MRDHDINDYWTLRFLPDGYDHIYSVTYSGYEPEDVSWETVCSGRVKHWPIWCRSKVEIFQEKKFCKRFGPGQQQEIPLADYPPENPCPNCAAWEIMQELAQ